MSALVHRGTVGSLSGHKFMGHPEQVSQRVRIDLGQADENGLIWDVMIRHIVGVGRFGE